MKKKIDAVILTRCGRIQWFLGIFICLQLSVYLLVTSTSLWIDQLVNGPLIEISSHNNIYIGVYTAANAVSANSYKNSMFPF